MGSASVDAATCTSQTTPSQYRSSSSGYSPTPFLLVGLAGESDFGSKMEAAVRGLVRLNAVNVAACSVLSRVDTSNQPACTGVSVVRDEEAAGSKPATPTQVLSAALSAHGSAAVLVDEAATLGVAGSKGRLSRGWSLPVGPD
jgi:hypothetical protein